jgi:hypothetical protein
MPGHLSRDKRSSEAMLSFEKRILFSSDAVYTAMTKCPTKVIVHRSKNAPADMSSAVQEASVSN